MLPASEQPESAKERSLRIPLDYLQRPDRLVRVKWQLSVLLLLLTGGYVAALAIFPRWGRWQASPGALAAAHASFYDDCQACHRQPLAPLRPDSLPLAYLGDPDRARQLHEAACLRCHDVPSHHPHAPAAGIPACAACHREHQGAGADLRRTADAHCTRCHAAIARHRQGESRLAPPLDNVTAFEGPAHPSFRSLASDPGNIRFNHWLHLQPGLALPEAQRKLRGEDLAPADRSRYRTRPEDGLVQLACGDCHQPDARTGGAYLRPIAYQDHCQACHPLRIALQPEKPLTVPHGTDRATLLAVLDGLVAGEALAGGRTAAEAPPADTARSAPDESGELPLAPGRTLGRNLARQLADDLLRQRSVALRLVAGQCLQCHEPLASADASGPGDSAPFVFPELAPANIPARWLRHGRFDHAAHRHVACRECHAEAYQYEQRQQPQRLHPPPENTRFQVARDGERVMIANKEVCVRCHAPRRDGMGGARHDCTACHEYHGGERRLDRALTSSLSKPLPPGNALLPALPPPTLRPVGLLPPGPSYVDERTCATAGCHGSLRPGATASARAAATWLARDPHREAEEVLWTGRARRMTWLLSRPAAATTAAPPAGSRQAASAPAASPSAWLSDSDHAAVLAQRCVACHALPGESALRADMGAGLGGVGCQACHGPASHWLQAHYLRGFDRRTPGFHDTKPFGLRAAACTPCHVGPAQAGSGPPQAVDHDLIAAGHPRLAFDVYSYEQSLPAHWDRTREQAEKRGFYHSLLWRAGHEVQAAQEAQLAAWLVRQAASSGPQDPVVPEFSTVDCLACHHPLAGRPRAPQAGAPWRPRVASLPLAPWQGAAPPPWPGVLEETIRVLESVPEEAMTYDTACRMYSLVRATAADLLGDGSTGARERPEEMAAGQALRAALSTAGRYLAQESYPETVRRGGGPTPYDGPTAFSLEDWRRAQQALVAALRGVHRTSSPGPRP